MKTVTGAVAVPARANLYVERFGVIAAEAARVRAGTAAPSTAGAGLEHGLRLVFTTLCSFGEVLAVAYAFPVAILAIGVPIALFLRLVTWIVGFVVM